MNALLILGNQLFEPKHLLARLGSQDKPLVYMREDDELCTYYRFHKQKIIFFLAAMRHYQQELKENGFEVQYEKMSSIQINKKYEDHLQVFLEKNKIKKLFVFEIEDRFFEQRLFTLLSRLGIEFETWASPMFLTSRTQFADYIAHHRKPFMKTFYELQRKRLQILVDRNQRPLGGQWSYDLENRKPLPRTILPPPLPQVKNSPFIDEATQLCETHFKTHPGQAGPFWLPIDRQGARSWLHNFADQRLKEFGPYEDALAPHSEYVFHSVLTPFLNTGLLTPEEVIETILQKAQMQKIELASLEGFIRQVIGWREFVRGIYQNFGEHQQIQNFWNHKKKLSKVWYNGSSGIPVLDRALQRVHKNGYLHHIERLMVIGSLMLLLEVDPQEAHRWFMEMFIDSSDWVMGPNVFGMALFSDGGVFATKPYICGSNYYRKMSGDPKGDWCDGVDGLYWGFIQKHFDFFIKNPRLSMMARTLQKMKPERLIQLKDAADELRSRLVV